PRRGGRPRGPPRRRARPTTTARRCGRGRQRGAACGSRSGGDCGIPVGTRAYRHRSGGHQPAQGPDRNRPIDLSPPAGGRRTVARSGSRRWAMGTSPTARIRNVVLLGHTGTGKSTLVEAMLRAAGVVSGPIDSCRTVDTDPEEQDRGHSLGLAVATFASEDHEVTVLDTPGGAEFLGDVWPALAAADLAVLVVDAAAGLQPQHHELWQLCEEHDLPRMVFLNKCDLDRVQYEERLAELREAWGDRLAVVELPWDGHGHLEGV